MNEINNKSLIQTTRPISKGINKSLERKVGLDFKYRLINSFKKYHYVIYRVSLNIKSENNTPFESFNLLINILSGFDKKTKIFK